MYDVKNPPPPKTTFLKLLKNKNKLLENLILKALLDIPSFKNYYFTNSIYLLLSKKNTPTISELSTARNAPVHTFQQHRRTQHKIVIVSTRRIGKVAAFGICLGNIALMNGF